MNTKTYEFITKLRKLEYQIKSAKLADYAYSDGEMALDLIAARVRAAIDRVEKSEMVSPSSRNSILRDANYLIMNATEITGMIIRSTSVRNAFELYTPFLNICQSILGDDCHLILTSEWQYIPFTFPQTLRELPQFVVIGLPASESDNALIFPAAGHELGHSVWLKIRAVEQFMPQVNGAIDDIFEKRKIDVGKAFPDIKGADFSQDMFVQYIKSNVYNSSMAQMEEYFSDFMGLILFGEGYLSAFEYLVAPQVSGTRSDQYPDTLDRVMVLSRYASTRLGVQSVDYHKSFLPDNKPDSPQSLLILDFADEVAKSVLDKIFDTAQTVLTDAKIALPSHEKTKLVEENFKIGIPYDAEAALGDLVNAAWRVFKSADNGAFEKQGRIAVDYLTDLVLKSAEIHEIRKYTS